MTIALGATWNPRGEGSRLFEFLPELMQTCKGIAVALPPNINPGSLDVFFKEPNYFTDVCWIQSRKWAWGRHIALRGAVEFGCSHIQYADMDRLLRWVETRPDEWSEILLRIQKSECVIVGRTKRAYKTHPQALIRTEAISNLIVSHFIGRAMDVSAGSKGFSLEAAKFLLEHSSPGNALGMDAEWPILLKRAGFEVDYVEVDGLDWESADRFRMSAADPEQQRKMATEYDADPQVWAQRVEVAYEISKSSIEATRKPLHFKEGQ